ncbi:unnamed protein product [Camellia sinensis]
MIGKLMDDRDFGKDVVFNITRAFAQIPFWGVVYPILRQRRMINIGAQIIINHESMNK